MPFNIKGHSKSEFDDYESEVEEKVQPQIKSSSSRKIVNDKEILKNKISGETISYGSQQSCKEELISIKQELSEIKDVMKQFLAKFFEEQDIPQLQYNTKVSHKENLEDEHKEEEDEEKELKEGEEDEEEEVTDVTVKNSLYTDGSDEIDFD